MRVGRDKRGYWLRVYESGDGIHTFHGIATFEKAREMGEEFTRVTGEPWDENVYSAGVWVLDDERGTG